MLLSPEIDTHFGASKLWGHRICSPEETFRSICPYFLEMGITRVADLTGLDTIGIPVFQSVRPMGRSLSVAQGKGVTAAAARTSAAMESTEGWHAENIPHLPITGRGPNLPGAISLEAYPGASSSERKTWYSALELNGKSEVLVPHDLVTKDFVAPREDTALPRLTNGLASGNTLEEAIASGLHELIERDALALFEQLSLTSQSKCRISPDQIGETARALLSAFTDAGYAVEIFDITSDLKVPAVKAVVYPCPSNPPKQGLFPQNIATGMGCHLDPETAVIRALTEAAQTRLTRIAGSRDDLRKEMYVPSPEVHLSRSTFMQMDICQFGYADFGYVNRSTPKSSGDVRTLLEFLRDVGFHDVYCCDLSREGFPVHVVKMIVPGLAYLSSNGPVPRWTK